MNVNMNLARSEEVTQLSQVWPCHRAMVIRR